MMDLISGLPEDIARECLIRVSYQQFPVVASVCKVWKTDIASPEFRRQRRSTGHIQNILIMVQARPEPEKSETGSGKRIKNPVYFLSVFEPKTGTWTELPPVPGFETGLPMFCQLTGVGPDLVLIGGLDPMTWKASNSVFIYNFLTAKWRRGTHMPGQPRNFFACVSDSHGRVFVAGGHDNEKNALSSVLVYDVMSDLWLPLPDMTTERDECKAVFNCGKLYVIGGYSTEAQGLFEKSAEVFDFATWQWSLVNEFLDYPACPKTLVTDNDDDDNNDENIYVCREGELMVMEDSTWQKIATVPNEIRHVAYVGVIGGVVLVIGSSGYGEEHECLVFDVKSNSWRKMDSPKGFRGHVQTGWILKI